jgi:DNA-binding response OmpR family regulator
MRVLVIEDDEVIAERIQAGLEKARYTVDVAYDGETGLRMARDGSYAVVLLDLMLPRRDGFSVCEALRIRGNRVPILMLTARGAVEDRVKGLDSGADDYLPKPFAFQELLARVRALARRESVHKSNVIRIGDLELDALSRSARRAGRDIALTPHEFSLLEALARNEGRTVTREMIQECVWGDDESYSNVVSYHVASLRKKLDADHPVKLIHTVYGVGYVLRAPAAGAGAGE